MNRTKIEWCDYTLNHVIGCEHWKNICSVGDVCYARKQAKRQKHKCSECYYFIPHLHLERLGGPYRVRKPSKIFVCSMGDLFGDWVPDEWIEAILRAADDNLHHTFIFLTKNPGRYKEFDFPANCWLGTTVNKQNEVGRILELVRNQYAEHNIKFVSFEPLLSPIEADLDGIDWVIIGAQTNPYRPPKPEWVKILLERARDAGAAVFLKNNLRWPEKIQEYPEVKK